MGCLHSLPSIGEVRRTHKRQFRERHVFCIDIYRRLAWGRGLCRGAEGGALEQAAREEKLQRLERRAHMGPHEGLNKMEHGEAGRDVGRAGGNGIEGARE